tara:strand:- start:1641 stop:2129 length:489 start_codon:yes stop_codon:yes gene_type:complete
MKKLILILFVSLPLFHCGQNKEKKSNLNTYEKELEQFIVDYYKTMSDRNWESFARFFSEKATLTTIWQSETDSVPRITTNTIGEFISKTADGPDSQPIFEEKPIEIVIEVKNHLANAWVKYEAKFGTKEELIEWKGHDLFSFLKSNEEWFIISITYLSIDEE